jgi:4-hydroxy-3-methylbut-2-enyl diphosphate reductase
MKIIKAEHLGMCFGVRDAIALAVDTARREPLTILGDLVHNETVLASLREREIQFAQQPAQVATNTVMITAHGASDQAINRARGHGLNVLQATCPLVHFAHRALGQLVAAGFHPVIIGQRHHVEVRGMTEDLAAFDVVLSAEDVAQLPPHPRIGIVAQTTQPVDKVAGLVGLIRRLHPKSEVHFRDTVCQPTKQRQQAAIELAKQADVVIVIGGVHSNNTRELVATCGRYCDQVYHVQTAGDLRPEWFSADQTVGITAGTSTPEETIAGVEKWLTELNFKIQTPNIREHSNSNLQTQLAVRT